MKGLEELLNELQVQNQQLQNILIQKQALTIQNQEIERALQEIENSGEDLYKTIGPILVKSNKEDLKKELADEKEESELKIKTLEKQETRIKTRVKEIQEKFQEFTKAGQGG